MTGGLSLSLVAAVASFGATTIAGYPLLGWLREAGVRQTVSEDAPERHATKQGTPTMGGLMMLAGIVAGGLVGGLAGRATRDGLLVMALTGVFGAIGFLDDWLIVKRGRNLGLTARQKMALQIVAAIAFVGAVAMSRAGTDATSVAGFDLGGWYYALSVVLVVGLSNATNLADGLDGLSAGMSAIILSGLVFSLDRIGWAAAALAGSCAGLLWFNAHPAQVFMGNTGALALGAALAGLAIVGREEVPLQVAAAVFWAETLSVMIQVGVFKWRKKRRGVEYARARRVFRRAPLHHHFEELGWPETRIVMRFWLATAVCTALALALSRTGWV